MLGVADQLFGCKHPTFDLYHVEPQAMCTFDAAGLPSIDMVLRCAAMLRLCAMLCAMVCAIECAMACAIVCAMACAMLCDAVRFKLALCLRF